MTDSTSLGRLERVSLRDVWLNEAAHFTPWLASKENLALLGDAVGIDLECEASEKEVGPFRADILCRDTSSRAMVLIENQLERTDHTHLGQLLTYAAGLDAVTIIWIAERFTDEHRAALDWLNEVTSPSINLFGLEIELWRIGTSPVAPKFNIVSQPNDWLKSASVEREGLTDTKALQLEFWTAFRECVLARKATPIKVPKALAQNWMNIPVGRTNLYLVAIASAWDSEEGTFAGHELRVEFMQAGEHADERYLALQADKEAIELALGEQLVWHRPENKRSRKVYVRRSARLDSREEWPEYHSWLLTKLERFHQVFAQRARALPPVGE